MEFTHATYEEFAGKRLPNIPKSPEEQIKLLEYAVGELTEWLMSELNWSNPADIADRLAIEVNRISQRAWRKYVKIDNKQYYSEIE